MLLAVYAVLILLIFCFAIGGYTFFAACRRKRELPWTDTEKLKTTSYAPYTDLIDRSLSWLESNMAQHVFVKSHDGLRLCGLWIPTENARGTILLAHGYRSTMLVDFGAVMDMYHKQGLNLLIPYQRSHGKSEGKYITFGVKESQDMLCWLEYHNLELSQCPVILSGLSMGASTVMYMLDQNLPSNVVASILDCGFTSPAEIIGKVFRDVVHVPGGFFIHFANIFAKILAGFSLYEKDSRNTLKQNKRPILMVHGKADDFVPCYMTEEGYACCSGDKKLLLVENAGHGLSFVRNQEEYMKLVLEILNKTL